MIDISLFGTTRVRLPHRVLEFTDFGGAKPRQILELLCLHRGRPQSAGALADALWGGSPPPSWPATLYGYVGLVRRALQPGLAGRESAVRTTSSGYLLTGSEVRLDIEVFAGLTAAADRAEPEAALPLWEQACELGARDLLEHEPYLRWAVQARTEQRSRQLRAALAGARTALQLGRPEAAARLARNATAADPHAEEGWQALIEGLHAAGRTAEARRAYRECEARLRELGETPERHTRFLAERELVAVIAGSGATTTGPTLRR